MATCIVCNKFEKNGKVFSAPANESRRKRWSESCGIELTPLSKVCEKHFLKSDFINAPGLSSAKRFRLQPGAVPSLELGNTGIETKHWKPVTTERRVVIIPKNCTQKDDISTKALLKPVVLSSSALSAIKKSDVGQVFHIPIESLRTAATVSKNCIQKDAISTKAVKYMKYVPSLEPGQPGNAKNLQKPDVLSTAAFCGIKKDEVQQVFHIPIDSVRKVANVSKDCIHKGDISTKAVENMKYVPSLELVQPDNAQNQLKPGVLRAATFRDIKKNEVRHVFHIPTKSIRNLVTVSKDCAQQGDSSKKANNAVENRQYVYSFELGKSGNQNNLCKPVALSASEFSGIKKNDIGQVFHMPIESVPKMVPLSKDCTQEENDSIIAKYIIENMDLKKRIKVMGQEVAVLKERVAENQETLNTLTNIFTEGQIRKMRCPKKQIHWQWEDIASAISLHAAGPKALPCESTLLKWTRKMKLEEGIQRFALDCMKYSFELSENEKLCILSFDEIKIASEDEKSLHSVKTPINYAQVAMVRSLNSSWKYPIFYAFNTKMSKSTIYSIIQELYEASFRVLALVSNMGPSNRTLWKELDISTEKTWFSNPSNEEEKIFVFADAPHLLKLIRNHFLDSGLKYNNGIVTSQTMRQLMQYTSSSDVTITHKITNDHLYIKSEDEQKVQLAAEVFSHTTASAIKQCYDVGKDLYNALDTADFTQLVNEWFDVLNSEIKNSQIPAKKPYGLMITHQNAVLEKMDHLMSQPIIPDSTTLAPFQKGILITNASLRLLHKYVKEKYNVEYLLTYKLNQAMLEDLFNDIKNNGELHDHPSPMDFKYRLRKYIIEKNTEILSNRGHIVAGDTKQLSSSTNSTSSSRNDTMEGNTEEMFDFCAAAAADVIKRLNNPTIPTSSFTNDIVIKTEETFDYY